MGEENAGLIDLVDHLRTLEARVAGLHIRESSTTAAGEPTDTERGVVLHYRDGRHGGESKLWVSGRRVKVRSSWVGPGRRSERSDRLTVELSERPVLGRVAYGSRAELARALVELMRDRVDGLGGRPIGVRPRATSPRVAGRPRVAVGGLRR